MKASGAAAPATVESETDPSSSMAAAATHPLFWSLVQNWGGRATNFIQFIILARFLGPRDFGLAASAALITLLIQVIAEFGFSDAIIQRPGLQRNDINGPFYLSLTMSLTLALTTFALSQRIEHWLNVDGLGRVLAVLSFAAPITTAALFQEAMYKRALAFKELAIRTMIANMFATLVSVPCAMMGFGVWSLVIQSYLAAIIGAGWIWRRPKWVPSWHLASHSLYELSRFSVFIFAMRLLDFGVTRFVEILIINRFGPRGYGTYTAGSRMNQTLMDLLQAALNDVSLSLLSRVSSDLVRLQKIYRTSIIIAGNTVSPVFILAASLMPEASNILLDQRWRGVDRIASALFIMSAFQCLQYFSRPYLGARGRSDVMLVIASLKIAVILSALRFSPATDIYEISFWYVIAQIMSSPLSLAATAWELKVPVTMVYMELFPVALAGATAFMAVFFARPALPGFISWSPVIKGGTLGIVFILAYVPVILVIGRRQAMTVINFGLARFKEGRHG